MIYHLYLHSFYLEKKKFVLVIFLFIPRFCHLRHELLNFHQETIIYCLVEVDIRGKKLREAKAPISINFPLFGCSRQTEEKIKVMGPWKKSFLQQMKRKFGKLIFLPLFQICYFIACITYKIVRKIQLWDWNSNSDLNLF